MRRIFREDQLSKNRYLLLNRFDVYFFGESCDFRALRMKSCPSACLRIRSHTYSSECTLTLAAHTRPSTLDTIESCVCEAATHRSIWHKSRYLLISLIGTCSMHCKRSERILATSRYPTRVLKCQNSRVKPKTQQQQQQKSNYLSATNAVVTNDKQRANEFVKVCEWRSDDFVAMWTIGRSI